MAMRYLVVGPGALGCLFTSLLAKDVAENNAEIWLLDHQRKRAELIEQQGLIYEHDGLCERINVRTAHSPAAVEGGDIIIFCVKAYDLIDTLSQWRSLLQSGTLALFLQNGIGHLQHHRYTGQATPVFGTCSEGATLVRGGHVRHCGTGETFLGFLSAVPQHAQTLLEGVCEQFNQCGLTSTLSNTMLERLWSKLFINVGINALTGIHQIPNGQILESENLLQTMTAAIHEARSVAQAIGINIHGDPVQTAVQVCRQTATNRSSMLQDLRKGRRTEIDAINGVIVQEGRKRGIKTPVNAELVNTIKAIHTSADGP